MQLLENVDRKVTFLTEEITMLLEKREKDVRLYDNQDMCQKLKVSNRTLQRYRDQGILPYIKSKGKIYYNPKDLSAFFEKTRTKNRE